MKPSPIGHGTVVNDRYEIRQSLGKGGMGEVFLAYDRSTQQTVALKVVREESRMPGDDEALRQELLHARSVSHPNVCRVHDLAPSPWGPILVMEHIAGQTLHSHIRRRKAHGGYTADEFRKIASEICSGLAAIHAQGLVHGDLKPGNVMVTDDKAVILDFGFAQERARLSSRRPGAPPDGGTPNYMSPERLRSGGASPDDDVYACGLTLWEMWTCRVPEPGFKPRARPMKPQIMFDVPSGLSIDEVKQIHRCLSDDPQLRPQARHMRFFNPTQMTASPIQVPRDRLDPGPPLGRAASAAFIPGAQSLLVTYATNAVEVVGTLVPLEKPVVTIGRKADRDIVVPEATVSGGHAVIKWQAGSWSIEDQGSTNGTYVDHSYERKTHAALMHGGEIQLGEMRVKLVSFAAETPHHRRARVYLVKRDGLTGLYAEEHMQRYVEEEASFAEWAEASLTVARYDLRGPNRIVSERPTILEMLALRRAAQRVVELTEMLLLSITPVVAGRTGPLKFAVAMLGPSLEEARHVVEQIVAQVQGMLPESLQLAATLVKFEPGRPAKALLDALSAPANVGAKVSVLDYRRRAVVTTKRAGTILMGDERPATDPALLATQMAPTPSHAEPSPASGHLGYVLAGKYRIVRLIGEGGMGAVYEGEHLEIGRRVAIKLVHAAISGTADIAERFRREARAAGAIESEHIVQVFDVGQDPNVGLFMVMEFLRGLDLAHTIVHGGPLEFVDACAIVVQTATALEAAHAAGIVHRDLKPANIFLVPRADGSTLAKIVDFGIAKVRDGGAGPGSAGITRVGSALGTPQYMAPEQAQGLPDIDLRVDVYALGCVLYEAITGQPAYAELPTYEQMIIQLVTKPTPHLRDLVADVPPALDAFCAEMMHRDPAQRPANMSAVVERLLAIVPDSATPVFISSVEGEGPASRVARSRQGSPDRRSRASVASTNTINDPVAVDAPGSVPGVPARSNGARWAAFGVLGLVALLGVAAAYVKLGRRPPEPAPAATASAAPALSAPPEPPASSAAPPVVTPVASASPPSSSPPRASVVVPSKPAPVVGGPLPGKLPKGGNGKVGSAGVAEQF